jgi:hypothetical protein
VATHQDLLEAINRVRAATGNRDAWQGGLSGDDIAAACNPFSSPSMLGAVLTKIVAAHPDAFLPGVAPSAPPASQGVAAAAIRDAETALAHQNSTAAQVDLQVVTAVLNAHVANADGAAELDRLQRDIEAAVLSRTDLDTPAGAREFQRYLIGKLREIRTVVDTAGLDATSKAALAVALASLYASATPDVAPAESEAAESTTPQQTSSRSGGAESPTVPDDPSAAEPSRPRESADFDLVPARTDLDDFASPDDVTNLDEFADVPEALGSPWDISAPPPDAMAGLPSSPMAPPFMPTPAMGPPAMPAPAIPPAAPAWGAEAPFGGMSALPDLGRSGLPANAGLDTGLEDLLPDRDTDLPPREDPPNGDAGDGDAGDGDAGSAPGDPSVAGVDPDPTAPDPNTVVLPDGQTITAPSPQIAAAIGAAVAGTAIPEAFRQQGIALPLPGSPVAAPLDACTLQPGDIGMFADRHALALGNGTALLDNQIQPVANVTGFGFLGWQHPPGPTTTNPQPPAAPAPAPAPTAPS